jgi:hypothetical protein
VYPVERDLFKMDIPEVVWGDMEWIALAQERDRWAFLNAVINLRFYKKRGIS